MSDATKARELLRAILAADVPSLDCSEIYLARKEIIAAALAAEREAGWRAGIEAAREIVCKAADECYAGVPTTQQVAVVPGTPGFTAAVVQVTTGAGQPADATVIERANADSLEAARLWVAGGYTGLTDRTAADDFARWGLAEHARAEAAVAECGWLRRTAIAELAKQRDAAEVRAEAMEWSRNGYEELLLAMQGRATAAEAALAEARAKIEQLRNATDNLLIAIDMGWDLDGVVAEMRAALEAGHGR